MSWSDAEPIFVAGPSRSGTAMLRSVLNEHPGVFLAGETHYFDDLRVRLGDGATSPLDEERSRIAQDYFLALAHRPYGHEGDPEQSSIPRSALAERAAAHGGGGDAYLRAYCELVAESRGATRWGEKTPRHIFQIENILRVFPEAKMICMVRDARAVVASYRDWENRGGFDFSSDPGHEQTLAADHERARRSYHPLTISILWRGAMNAASAAARQFGSQRVRLQSYEALVANPEEAVREVASWLGLSFDERMLSVPMHNSSYAEFQKSAGFSTEPTERWRKKLTAHEIGLIESACGGALEEMGYELVRPRVSRVRIGASWAWWPVSAGRAAMANRRRLGSLPSYVWRRLRFAAAGRSKA